jgi:hypothetical protein
MNLKQKKIVYVVPKLEEERFDLFKVNEMSDFLIN